MRELLESELKPHALDFSIVDEGQCLSNRSGYDVPVIYADIEKTRRLMQGNSGNE